MTFFIFIDHNLFYSGTEMASIFHILAFLYLLTSQAFDSRAEDEKDEPEKNLAAEIKSLRNTLGPSGDVATAVCRRTYQIRR